MNVGIIVVVAYYLFGAFVFFVAIGGRVSDFEDVPWWGVPILLFSILTVAGAVWALCWTAVLAVLAFCKIQKAALRIRGAIQRVSTLSGP